MRMLPKMICAIAAVVCGLATPAAHAVMIPYVADFSGTPPEFTFTPPAPGEWNVGGGTLNLVASGTDAGTTRSAAVEVENIGVDFVVSSTVHITEWTNPNTSSFGFALLSASSDFSAGASTNNYLADINNASNTMRIIGGAGQVINASNPLTFVPDETYSFTVKGTYSDLGALTLEFTVDPANGSPVTVMGTDPNPLTGAYFGFRYRSGTGISEKSISAQIHTFSIVPEPASLGLVLVGLVGIAAQIRGKWRAVS